MIKIRLTFFLLAIFIILSSFRGAVIQEAQDVSPTTTLTPTPTPDNSGAINDLQNIIKEYQGKINDLEGQANTLSSQIKIMDNQITLTELRINATKQKIAGLEKDINTAKDKIGELGKSINESTKALVGRIDATYQVGRIDSWQLFLTSSNISNLLTRLTYLKVVQANDKKTIYAAQQNKENYSNEKQMLEQKQKEEETLKKQLEGYTDQLNHDKEAKQSLLSVTKNDESRYQKLLQDAQSQMSAFKSFASFAGGASILPPQPSPDGWYYNQRDERWATKTIGTSGDQMWAVGCLITSTTMVLKKHGQNVTPGDTAGNSSYYFSNTAYMLLPWLGGKFTASWGSDTGAIDSKLSSGEPVIVGLRAGAYGQHFVVLKSGSGGNYKMNDPWYGPDLDFSSHYSTGQIFQYGWYSG